MPLKLQMELLNDLKRFGLNPNDWIVRRAREAIYEIRHRQDPAFQLRGRIERRKQKREWKDLALQSL